MSMARCDSFSIQTAWGPQGGGICYGINVVVTCTVLPGCKVMLSIDKALLLPNCEQGNTKYLFIVCQIVYVTMGCARSKRDLYKAVGE